MHLFASNSKCREIASCAFIAPQTGIRVAERSLSSPASLAVMTLKNHAFCVFFNKKIMCVTHGFLERGSLIHTTLEEKRQTARAGLPLVNMIHGEVL